MTLLNRSSNGLVSSLVVLWRAARVFGPRSRADLAALCRPRGEAEPSRVLSDTFATWKLLEMFVEGADDIVRLASPFDTIDPADIEALRTAVLDLLLRPSNCPALLTTDLKKDDEVSRASDFVRIASWALAQDPYCLASWSPGRVPDEASAQGLELWRGDGRWPAFQDWAYFVGLGVTTPYGMIMSPARAVREILREARPRVLLTATEDTLLSAFLDELARALPVLDGGAYRAQIDEVLRARGHGYGAYQVSPCLALALLQLDHEEEIVLSDRHGDVATRLSLVGRNGRVVRTASHIRRGAPRRGRHTSTTAKGARA